MLYQTVFERYEIKYMISKEEKEKILDLFSGHMVLDQYGRTNIRNVYYDTENHRLIRRSLEKPFYKEKLRTRSYNPVGKDDMIFIELKKKYNSVVYKRRMAMAEGEAEYCLNNGKSFKSRDQIPLEIDSFRNFYGHLEPSVFISYEREAYYDLSGGSFKINSKDDGLSSSGYTKIEGGTFDISTEAADDSTSAKGIKSDGDMNIDGGTFKINSSDDSFHSNSNITFAGGDVTAESGDDGFHADADLTVKTGNIQVTDSYEGLEGQNVYISGGEISVKASDDGINAAGGNDSSGFGKMGDDMFASEDSEIVISGGKIDIDVDGDGIDSNGSLTVSGGETYVFGPTNDGNGALDYNSSAKITGGKFIALGSAGMAMNFGTDSTQGSMLVSISGSAGTELTAKDNSGNTILSCTPEKSYSCAVISCPEIKKGGTYTVSSGGNSSSVTMSSLVYSDSGVGANQPGGNTGGPGGGHMMGRPR